MLLVAFSQTVYTMLATQAAKTTTTTTTAWMMKARNANNNYIVIVLTSKHKAKEHNFSYDEKRNWMTVACKKKPKTVSRAGKKAIAENNRTIEQADALAQCNRVRSTIWRCVSYTDQCKQSRSKALVLEMVRARVYTWTFTHMHCYLCAWY